MMQTLNLYDTTGVNGYRVVRTRIARNHGKARAIGTEKELEKASKAVAKRAGRGRSPDRRFIVTIEPKGGLVCPCGSDDIKVYKVRKRLIQCHPFGLLPSFVEIKVHQFYCRHCHKLHYEHLPFLTEPKAKRKYVTVVRDLDSGAELNVSRGKGEDALTAWIAKARVSKVREMISMTETVAAHLEGILGYWKFRKASNAATEGFNNKIRWLIKQAYGYRDYRYFRLKVFDLPNLKTTKSDI